VVAREETRSRVDLPTQPPAVEDAIEGCLEGERPANDSGRQRGKSVTQIDVIIPAKPYPGPCLFFSLDLFVDQGPLRMHHDVEYASVAFVRVLREPLWRSRLGANAVIAGRWRPIL
jgi:hypothetical protein